MKRDELLETVLDKYGGMAKAMIAFGDRFPHEKMDSVDNLIWLLIDEKLEKQEKSLVVLELGRNYTDSHLKEVGKLITKTVPKDVDYVPLKIFTMNVNWNKFRRENNGVYL